MANWPESWKQTLRHLAAARFYLPVTLKGGEKYDVEEQYRDYLHNREYGLALEELAEWGIENAGFAEEALFWAEMELAAREMGLAAKAAEYRRRRSDAGGGVDE